MAKLTAATAFDLTTLDLSVLLTHQTAFGSSDDAFETVGTTTYDDSAAFEYTQGDVTYALYAYGRDLDFGPDFSTLAGGTVQALVQYAGAIETHTDVLFQIKGLALDGAALTAAILTADPADEAALLADAFSGNDRMTLSDGNDHVLAYGGADVVRGLGGDDVLEGGTGADRLYGGDGNDILSGDAGNDVIAGGAGNDTASYASAEEGVTVSLRVTDPQDTHGAGTDTLTSIENLTGSAYGDLLSGNGDANILNGGAGDDSLRGRGGDDWLAGGLGNDVLRGGSGADSFVFDHAPATGETDRVTDFSHAGGDRIVLSTAAFAGLVADDLGHLDALHFTSGAGAVATGENAQIVYDSTTGTLSFDADGAGTADAVTFATLDYHPALAASDILLIA